MLADECRCASARALARQLPEHPRDQQRAEVTDAQAINPADGIPLRERGHRRARRELRFRLSADSASIRGWGTRWRPGGDEARGHPLRAGLRRGAAGRSEGVTAPAALVGYPVSSRLRGGGGAAGVVHTEAALVNAVNTTRTEARSLRKPHLLPREVPSRTRATRDPVLADEHNAPSTWASATARCRPPPEGPSRGARPGIKRSSSSASRRCAEASRKRATAGPHIRVPLARTTSFYFSR